MITSKNLAKALGIGAVLAVASAGSAFAAVATESLNVRSGPGTGYPIIGALPVGQYVDILSQSGSWCLIDVPGPQGWVACVFLGQGYAPYYQTPYYDYNYDYYGGPVFGGYFPGYGYGHFPPPHGHFPPPHRPPPGGGHMPPPGGGGGYGGHPMGPPPGGGGGYGGHPMGPPPGGGGGGGGGHPMGPPPGGHGPSGGGGGPGEDWWMQHR